MLAGLAAAALLLASRLHPAFAWLVCAPLFALHGDEPLAVARALRSGAVAGATFAACFALAAHAPWLIEAGTRYFGLSLAGSLAGSLALTLGCGLAFGAVLGLLLACARTLPVACAVPAYGAVWAVWESATLMSFPSYPWVALAATQTDLPAVVQMVSIAGQAGLSLVLAAAGAALGWSALQAHRRRLAWRPAAAVLVTLSAVLLYGTLRLQRASASEQHAACTIAGVDARIAAGGLSAPEAFERHAAATLPALELAPDVVVWPESSLPSDPQLDADLLARLRSLVDRRAIVLLVGAPRTGWGPGWSELRHNSLHRIAPGRALVAYDKRFPVPIAERWPWRWIAPPGALRVAEVAPGATSGLVDA
ncbi:MAG: hypothetical protein AB1689_18290, partial [Thermodesulfobacteriota bacterium]